MSHSELIAQFTTETGELDLGALDAIDALLRAGQESGWSRRTPQDHLHAVRLLGRISRRADASGTTCISDANATKAAKVERTYLSGIIQAETNETSRAASNAVLSAIDAARYPTFLAAYANGQLSRRHVTRAARTLNRCERFFDPEVFDELTASLLERAVTVDPDSFVKDCENLLRDVDEKSGKAQDELAKLKIEQSRADRGIVFMPRDRNHPEFGTDVRMHLTQADCDVILPVLDRISQGIRYRRRAAKQPGLSTRERYAAALVEVAHRFTRPTSGSWYHRGDDLFTQFDGTLDDANSANPDGTSSRPDGTSASPASPTSRASASSGPSNDAFPPFDPDGLPPLDDEPNLPDDLTGRIAYRPSDERDVISPSRARTLQKFIQAQRSATFPLYRSAYAPRNDDAAITPPRHTRRTRTQRRHESRPTDQGRPPPAQPTAPPHYICETIRRKPPQTA
ncbi:hypothetical protein [Bowdeniella massiliensis]|uniref:hypothetical protein n=1 Tax=Bowdeniella massiliensis TaxID=2932264 RepID=UPI0020292CCC|nr:hypothetical protein [Bowdeniella massiliensis]